MTRLPTPIRLPSPSRVLQALSKAPLPKPLSQLLLHLPQLPPSMLLATLLNMALGEAGLMAIPPALTGRQLRLVVTDAGLELTLILTAQGFVPPNIPALQPDVIIKAAKRDFLDMATRTVDSDTLFFNRRLVMEGDTELGLLVRNLLDAVDLSALTPAQFSPLRMAIATRQILAQRRRDRLVFW